MSEKTTDTDCCVSLVKRKRESSKLRKSLCRSQKRSKSLLELQKKLKLQEEKKLKLQEEKYEKRQTQLQKKLKLQEEKYAKKLKKAAEKKIEGSREKNASKANANQMEFSVVQEE